MHAEYDYGVPFEGMVGTSTSRGEKRVLILDNHAFERP